MPKPDRLRAWVIAALALVLAGCAGTTEYPNQSLASGASNPVPPDLPSTLGGTRPMILMAFSGGGSRAAALALAVVEELKKYDYSAAGQRRRLADDVDVVSSVSGGSVTAAYFGLYGLDAPQRLDDFLNRDNMATLELDAANPITWAKLTFGSYTRVDALRDLLDRQLFDKKTFGDIAARGHPVVLLNASDMGSGEVFTFTPARFNDICSNLGALPISVGVSASAAFPVLLSPVDLKDYAGPDCAGDVPMPGWITVDLRSKVTPFLNIEEFKEARYANSLRRGKDAFRDVQYVHLLDGGLEDNVGVHSLLSAMVSPHDKIGLLNAINNHQISKLVVIAVNARSDPGNSVSTDAHTPGIIPMIQAVTSNPIDAATSGAVAELRALIDEIKRAAEAASKAPKPAGFAGMKVYEIEIDFDQLLPAQHDLQSRVKAIPTLWKVTPAERRDLDEAGRILLDQHPCFQKLLLDLNAMPAPADPDVASICN